MLLCYTLLVSIIYIGKTHTMSGEQNGIQRGIIPRSIEQILRRIVDLKAMGWVIQCTISIVELYNEELRDLLVRENGKEKFGDTSANEKLRISFQNGKVSVLGLTNQDLVSSNTVNIVEDGLNQLKSILKFANQSRTTAATNMNEHSSRSHVIYMIDVIGSLNTNNQNMTLHGGLRLVRNCLYNIHMYYLNEFHVFFNLGGFSWF